MGKVQRPRESIDAENERERRQKESDERTGKAYTDILQQQQEKEDTKKEANENKAVDILWSMFCNNIQVPGNSDKDITAFIKAQPHYKAVRSLVEQDAVDTLRKIIADRV